METLIYSDLRHAGDIPLYSVNHMIITIAPKLKIYSFTLRQHRQKETLVCGMSTVYASVTAPALFGMLLTALTVIWKPGLNGKVPL